MLLAALGALLSPISDQSSNDMHALLSCLDSMSVVGVHFITSP